MTNNTLPAVVDPLPRRLAPTLIEQAGNGALRLGRMVFSGDA